MGRHCDKPGSVTVSCNGPRTRTGYPTSGEFYIAKVRVAGSNPVVCSLAKELVEAYISGVRTLRWQSGLEARGNSTAVGLV